MALARRIGARLTMVDVVEDLHLAADGSHTALPDDLLALRREDIAIQIRDLVDDAAPVDIKVLVGNPPIAIIQEVLRSGYDLVVKTARGPDTGWGGRLFGSTAIKLMRKCPVPVWAFKPAPEIRFPRILAAVGPPPPSEPDNRLNNEIISLAAAFARTAASRLDILHCWQLAGESLLTSGRTRIPAQTLEALRARSSERAHRHMDALVQAHDLSGINHHVHLKHGPVDTLLPSFIETEKIDLVVMGSLAQTNIAGLIAGSTAEQIFYAANCAVMVVKPPDFISPVAL
jgi:nucleotide-binding universal stress UspA family protein